MGAYSYSVKNQNFWQLLLLYHNFSICSDCASIFEKSMISLNSSRSFELKNNNWLLYHYQHMRYRKGARVSITFFANFVQSWYQRGFLDLKTNEKSESSKESFLLAKTKYRRFKQGFLFAESKISLRIAMQRTGIAIQRSKKTLFNNWGSKENFQGANKYLYQWEITTL